MLDAPLSSFAKVLKRDDCSAELTHFLFLTDSEPPAVAGAGFSMGANFVTGEVL